jgi:hypothetical protein
MAYAQQGRAHTRRPHHTGPATRLFETSKKCAGFRHVAFIMSYVYMPLMRVSEFSLPRALLPWPMARSSLMTHEG